jgi:hypothetical protein
MTDQIVIDDSRLAEQIQQIAQQEHRSVGEVLAAMVTQYRPQTVVDEDDFDPDELARKVRLYAYQQARDYWRKAGDLERAAMTDAQLDEEFWLFDAEDIPRLKSEMNEVELPPSSLHRAGKILASAGFRSGRTDISARSREILENEYADYLLSRMNQSTNDADNSTPP